MGQVNILYAPNLMFLSCELLCPLGYTKANVRLLFFLIWEISYLITYLLSS